MSVGYQTEVYMSVPQQPANDPKPKTWIERTAARLAANGDNPEDFILAMEAAAEMRCVALKVALGRCHQILFDCNEAERVPSIPDGLFRDIEALLK